MLVFKIYWFVDFAGYYFLVIKILLTLWNLVDIIFYLKSFDSWNLSDIFYITLIYSNIQNIIYLWILWVTQKKRGGLNILQIYVNNKIQWEIIIIKNKADNIYRLYIIRISLILYDYNLLKNWIFSLLIDRTRCGRETVRTYIFKTWVLPLPACLQSGWLIQIVGFVRLQFLPLRLTIL